MRSWIGRAGGWTSRCQESPAARTWRIQQRRQGPEAKGAWDGEAAGCGVSAGQRRRAKPFESPQVGAWERQRPLYYQFGYHHALWKSTRMLRVEPRYCKVALARPNHTPAFVTLICLSAVLSDCAWGTDYRELQSTNTKKSRQTGQRHLKSGNHSGVLVFCWFWVDRYVFCAWK